MNYGEWRDFTFALRDPAFCLDSPAPYPGSSTEAAQHLLYFFQHAPESVARIPQDKLNAGLWIIPSIDGYGGLLSSADVPQTLRFELVDAHFTLFSTLFWSDGFDGAAFMWWEHLPGAQWLNGVTVSHDRPICDRVVAVLQRILELDSHECQKDALHGLNEFGPFASDTLADKIINQFLKTNRPISSEIRQYAESVLAGQAQ